MSAFMPLLEDKRASATAVEPAPRDLVHPSYGGIS